MIERVYDRGGGKERPLCRPDRAGDQEIAPHHDLQSVVRHRLDVDQHLRDKAAVGIRHHGDPRGEPVGSEKGAERVVDSAAFEEDRKQRRVHRRGAERAVLRMGGAAPRARRDRQDHPGLRGRRLLGAQYRGNAEETSVNLLKKKVPPRLNFV